MSGEIIFGHGDLLEYTRPVAGLQSHDQPITVRGIVLGFGVMRSTTPGKDGELSTRVWVYEGSHQFADWEDAGVGRVMEGKIEKEPSVVIWTVSDLLSFDNFRVVKTGNHVTELFNFEVGMEPEEWE